MFKTRHRIKSFDPSLLVRNSPAQLAQTPEAYLPKHTFSDFGFPPQLVNNIAGRNYSTLTPIQDQVIPLLLEGKDVVGLANTGTGKTASFLLPFIKKVDADRSQKVLIMAPTRELAVQIEEELKNFSRQMKIFSALCIGGVSMQGQIRSLYPNPNFVIGTPGRLKDLSLRHKIVFSSFNTVVLDEVDRMLDMGFIHNMTDILSALPKLRQSAFFSATMTPQVQKVMNTFLKNPITISIKTHTVISNIAQDVIKTNGKPKIDVLHNLLIQDGFDKVLVFGRTKWGLERLATDLARRGFAVVAIHGNKSQGQRQRSLAEFKNNRVKVLLATDVASRGLDIDDVTHVINFDLPESYEDYIHRIGRTGRASKTGIALTLVP
ncbi:MAG: DEAD/DEAH box helicase domain protein [Candidatus Amesbacteria bacterium GW2011_GWA2_47_70]|uniref:DEAD/DEAH box helicase domain protein n=1 Tax=Candidatus Amesbacteria bacterium GW2011_GWC2_45_19 TaxID=1618366 RepID=A0A0G1M5D0_9BACT|nr:MAG: DEAD/DEAH box helicase domain protein [Candidatus Amesbacteria bacterium GW2011_GWC2_45_19]KKU68941.1 MAG: DEAD/DEAH box helicase domain protein [Microgenomates group bacterium GW2011_GWC1_47_20]KKU78776.1 MAG: DEAD/DEAH box helicase domain protein [Candidatus Amesbacteria bacterium GW2011_GWA2_47_70]